MRLLALFWDAKIARHRARDREVTRELRSKGWRVVRIWEHALTGAAAACTVRRVIRVLAAGQV